MWVGKVPQSHDLGLVLAIFTCSEEHAIRDTNNSSPYILHDIESTILIATGNKCKLVFFRVRVVVKRTL